MELKNNEQTVELKFTAKVLMHIEKSLGKKPTELLVKNGEEYYYSATIEDVAVILQESLNVDQETALLILDQNNGKYYDILSECIKAYSNLIIMAKAGNSTAPN